MVRISVCVCVFVLLACCLPMVGQQSAATLANDPAAPPAAITGSGTAGFVPVFTGITTIGNSKIFQTVGLNVGIGITAPTARLDVNGTGNVRDTLTLFPKLTHPTLSVHGTAFAVSNTGRVTFVSGQTFPGTGTITGVSAGTGLLGGGNSGHVTLSLNTSFTDGRYARLGASNTFVPDQNFDGNIFLSGFVSAGGDLDASGNANVNNVNASGNVNAGGDVNSGVTVFAQQGVFGVSTSHGFQTVISQNDGSDQALQVQNFANPIGGFTEAQFDMNGTATFFTDAFGDTTARGTKSAAVPLKSGQMVKVFSMESPEVWFEDFGSATLTGGITTVFVDAKFAQTVNMAGYHVFVTPKGDCKGLFITNETSKSFEVRELGGGQSSVGFDYRIVAHRKGYETMRLPAAKIPTAKMEHAPLRSK
jgi:hypothetical protein